MMFHIVTIYNTFGIFYIHLGYPTYIVPLVIIPPIPSLPYLVLLISFNKSMLLLLSEKAIEDAIIAGSSA